MSSTTPLSILMCSASLALLLAGCEADDGGKATRQEATPMERETQAPNTTASAAPTAVAAAARKPAPTLLDADVPSQLETATFALG